MELIQEINPMKKKITAMMHIEIKTSRLGSSEDVDCVFGFLSFIILLTGTVKNRFMRQLKY